MTDRTYYIASASVVAIVIASASWAMRAEDRAPLSADATEKALGQLAPAQHVQIPFRFHNGSSRPIQIVGATSTCSRDGCFGYDAFATFPMTIPPGGDGVLDSTFKAGDSGTISHSMTVFTDCEQVPKIDLSVTGQIVAPLGADGL